MTVTIQKWGNSQGIRIPKNVLETLDLKENEKINLSIKEDKIIIEKIKKNKRKNINELFENYKGDYIPEEIDWGSPEGREIW